MKNYIQKIRSKIGKEHFIHPAARILVENQNGEFLMIRRIDNDKWGIPAGALEEGETIEQCAVREVQEQTGIVVNKLVLIGISTNPDRETTSYPNGDIIQYFSIEFYCNDFSGTIHVHDVEEVKYAMWKPKVFLNQLPHSESSIIESWHHYQQHHIPMVK